MLDSKMLLTRKGDGDTALEVWGVWIPRRGDNVIFTVEVTGIHGTYFAADFYQKNYGEAGDGTSASAGLVFDEATGRQSVTKVGAKELVRVKLTLQRGASLDLEDVGWVLYRFLQPVWFESVRV